MNCLNYSIHHLTKAELGPSETLGIKVQKVARVSSANKAVANAAAFQYINSLL